MTLDEVQARLKDAVDTKKGHTLYVAVLEIIEILIDMNPTVTSPEGSYLAH